MAEQAINTIYLLGQQPDALCGTIIKNLTANAFDGIQTSLDQPIVDAVETLEDELETPSSPSPANVTLSRSTSHTSQQTAAVSETEKGTADSVSAFALSQLIFVVGHVALKHIVYLELVEREFKRRKDEKAKEKAAAKAAQKDDNDLDAVTGNAEDDIGDLITTIRERELLYGEKSLLAAYGPLIAGICASPKRYRVSKLFELCADSTVTDTSSSRSPCTHKVHVCERRVLREPSPPALPHPGNQSRSSHSQQHCHRARRLGRMLGKSD